MVNKELEPMIQPDISNECHVSDLVGNLKASSEGGNRDLSVKQVIELVDWSYSGNMVEFDEAGRSVDLPHV